MVLQDSYWWPVDLPSHIEEKFDDFAKETLRASGPPDHDILNRTITLLGEAMRPHLADLIERDGLPHLAHIIVGWGDADWQGETLTDRIAPFVNEGPFGPSLLQCDPEGDFHPWQSLAYAVMAGAEPDRQLGSSKASLRDLATNSRILQTEEGSELGHLLFALASLDPDINGRHFSLNNDGFSVKELMDKAVYAHHAGPFNVCRKFHLTEGICAASSRIEGLESFRPHAAGFLDGQMNVLKLFAFLLHEIRQVSEGLSNGDLMHELRDILRIGDNLENHVFYAGHLLELSGFAQCYGFRLTDTQVSAVAHTLNEMNLTLLEWMPRLSFPDCFLSLGHYRRAVTLWIELERVRRTHQNLDRSVLSRYTMTFEEKSEQERPIAPLTPPINSVYEVSRTQSKVRSAFAAALRAYEHSVKNRDMQARGKFDHFRRIGPPHWPRSLHYEILDHGNAIGTEIHLESEEVLPCQHILMGLADRIRHLFPETSNVVWDPRWYKGRGRFVIHHDEKHDANTIARSMNILIDATYHELDRALSKEANIESLSKSKLNS